MELPLSSPVDTSRLERRKPKQSRSDATRSAIVLAATQVLEEEGFSAFSMRSVAGRAEVSVGALYDYYPSKHALLYWVVENRLKKRVDTIDEVLAESDFESKSLHQVIEDVIDALNTAGLYSRLDLEIRAAEDADLKLSVYTTEYKEELTQRYIDIWRQYGSMASDEHLKYLAEYAHQLDTLSMKMQLAHPNKSSSIRQLNRTFFHELAEKHAL